MEQKCANCGNGKWRDGVTPITETCCKCKYVDKGALVPQPSNWIPKEQTNADRIRAMTDEELAKFIANKIVNIESHKMIEQGHTPTATQLSVLGATMYDTLMMWLKQPAEEEST